MAKLVPLLLAFLLLVSPTAVWAGPSVDIAVGPQPPKLVKFAADEMAAQLKKLFEAEVRIAAEPAADAAHVIFLGNPTTSPSLAKAADGAWPKLTDQGHVVRSLKDTKVPTLIVGGGSDAATLWAVYELGHHFGIRYLPLEDVYPPEGAKFRLDGLDIVLDTTLAVRGWRLLGSLPSSTVSWSAAELEKLVGQLAKNKINLVVFDLPTNGPFVQYSIGKATTSSARLHNFNVNSDTPGRRAFHGAKEFTNPDFSSRTTFAEQLAAAKALVERVSQRARELGMSAGVQLKPLDFPHEFRHIELNIEKRIEKNRPRDGGERLAASLRNSRLADEKNLPPMELLELRAACRVQLDAYRDTYPDLAPWLLSIDGANLRELLGDVRPFPASPQGHPSCYIDGTVANAEDRAWALQNKIGFEVDTKFNRAPTDQGFAGISTITKIVAHDHDNQLLPTNELDGVRASLTAAREQSWRGFTIDRDSMSGEALTTLYLQGRHSFQTTTAGEAIHQLFLPIAGREDVAQRLVTAFEFMEQANHACDVPAPADIFGEFMAAGQPMPLSKFAGTSESLKKALDLYTKSYSEVLRGHGNCHADTRPLLFYHAKRGEFSVHYLTAMIALAAHHEARQMKDVDAQVEQLEKAIEAIYNAGNALGEVARDQSDRGLIVELDHYVYRPLVSELERLTAKSK